MFGDVWMLVPKYLEGWTHVKKNATDAVVAMAVCKCGHTWFYAFRNIVVRTREEIEADEKFDKFVRRCLWRSFHMGPLKDGNLYYYRRNFLGIIVDKIRVSDILSDTTSVVKIKCTECSEEYIAFDNRIHGYDASTEEKVPISYEHMEFKQRKFKNSKDNIAEIEIRIINQLSFEEFSEGLDEAYSMEEYSNAFGSIDIYAKVKDLTGKKIEIFSEETA